jgi:hypothetical protein
LGKPRPAPNDGGHPARASGVRRPSTWRESWFMFRRAICTRSPSSPPAMP